MNEIRFIDGFSGIGGFRKGLEQAGGYRCVWSNDFNKYANQVYTKQFGEEGHYTGDIRGVDPTIIPDFDLLCAGFPCQAFSVAGKRRGFQDTRGTLFFEICRIAEAKRPSLLLLENVKGLLNHDQGRTFTVILQTLDELGYWVEWQVLNSKHFGVPQNRERVFIVGRLRGTGGREIFPITEDDRPIDETEDEINGENSLSLTAENAGGWNARGTYIEIPKNAATLTGGAHSGGLHSDMTIIHDPYNQNIRGDGLAGAIKTNQGSPTSAGTAVSTTKATERIRRLTPIECERLQGFPDGWTEGISNTQRYKCIGNAVTVNVIEFLGRKLRSSLSTADTNSAIK